MTYLPSDEGYQYGHVHQCMKSLCLGEVSGVFEVRGLIFVPRIGAVLVYVHNDLLLCPVGMTVLLR